MFVNIKLEQGATAPTRAHPSDAGLDLYSNEEVRFEGHTLKLIGTGVHIEIPEGCFGMLCLRSSFARDSGMILANGVGIIDSGYRGEVKAALWNRENNPKHIQKGERFAQLLILPCLLPEVKIVEELSDTDRGSGGFGSTGS